MKKIILTPDSFKGTMSAIEICEIMQQQIHAFYPHCKCISVPAADGGEGSVDCFLLALGGKKVRVEAMGPKGELLHAYYGLLHGGKTAVVELAACAGLPLVYGEKNPLVTTTYGVGQLIGHAVKSGCSEVVLALGGSATNDGGVGIARALGIQFYNEDNREFLPVGGTLQEITRIDMSGMMKELKHVKLMVMCDVDNPMYGENGAAFIFAPQKGADEDMVQQLDKGLRHLNDVMIRDIGVDVSEVAGSGAAGAVGAGMVAFFGASLQSGIETLLDVVDYDTLLQGCDMVFSGEGRLDKQSLHGKVISGVAKRAKAQGVPLVAVVGNVNDGIEEVYDIGVSAVFSTNRVAVEMEQARARSREDLASTMQDIMRLIEVVHHS